MVLIKKILLFLLSIVFSIILLIGATTSYAKDEFDLDTLETNHRLYTIEWIDIADQYGKKFVCGTKVSILDYSGKKYIIEYYYLLKNNNKIVTIFDVNALQISIESFEPVKTEKLKIKLFASFITKDDKNILAGMRGEDNNYKGVGAEYKELDLSGNTELFKTLYQGGYNLDVYVMPNASTIVPVGENIFYTKDSEKTLLNCIDHLLENQEKESQPKGEVSLENAKNVG